VFLSSTACSDCKLLIKLQSAEFVIGRKLLAEEVSLMVRDVRLQMASHTRVGSTTRVIGLILVCNLT